MASIRLENFVQSFELYKIGLNDDISTKVCSESSLDLYECISSTTDDNVKKFYQSCLDFIDEIFQRGAKDLQRILGN